MTNKAKMRVALIILCLIMFYLIENLSFLSAGFIKPPRLLLPVLWLLLSWLIWWLPRPRAEGRLRLRTLLIFLAVVSAGLFLLAMLATGFIEGFGKSPYAFTPLALLTNFFVISTTILGRELARAFILNSLATRRSQILLVLISLVFLFGDLSLNKLSTLDSMQQFVTYAGTTILPEFSENLLVSYLAYLGGPLPAFIYQAMVEGFYWFSPLLPNTGWVLKTLLGCVVPIGCLFLVQYLYQQESGELKRTSEEKGRPGEWLTVSVISILIIWFTAGVFPVYPSVIATGSMEPLIKPGDVIILKKVGSEGVRAGDVIHFRQEDIFITHRVIDVIDPEGKIYQTKGDNNETVDLEFVSQGQIKGKLICVIPKLGWPTLILRARGTHEAISGEEI